MWKMLHLGLKPSTMRSAGLGIKHRKKEKNPQEKSPMTLT
jgi:hypothetical protein